jgi:hypothetical protein
MSGARRAVLRSFAMRERGLTAAVVTWLPGLAAALVSIAACSSSKGSGTDAGPTFDQHDASHHDAGQGTKPTGDSGTTHVMPSKDSGGPTTPLGDGSCGSYGGVDWCQQNAPDTTGASNVLCDDFDRGVLSSEFDWVNVTRQNLVNAQYVSPFCSLLAQFGDAGPSFTQHGYPSAPSSGGATIAFDLLVPGGGACNGAVIAYFVALPGETPDGSIDAWLSVSDVSGSGSLASSYTVSLSGFVGATPADGGAGATISTPVTVSVTPRATDKGWARVELDITSYALAVSPTDSTAQGTVSWSYIGVATPEKTSSAMSLSGAIGSTGTTNLDLDVGLFPNLVGGSAGGSCQVFVDNYVSNLTD